VCDLETSRMGAPYIYDISHLRVNEPAMQYLKQTPQHGGSSTEIKTGTDCHITISLLWKLSKNITFQ